MKTHQEIHNDIENWNNFDLLKSPSLSDILYALNERISELQKESASDYVELIERIRKNEKVTRSLCEIDP